MDHGSTGTVVEARPLSPAQEGIWVMDQMDPGSPAYNIAVAVRLLGPLDPVSVEGAVNRLVRRHDALRVGIHDLGGEPRQRIATDPVVKVGVQAAAASDLPQLLRECAAIRFDLSRAPLLRARVFRLGAHEHVLCVVFHHIVCDGWSVAIALRDLASLYRDCVAKAGPSLPPPAVRYLDYVWAQREGVGNLEDQLAYWRGQLAHLSVDAGWPPRPAQTRPDRAGGVHRFHMADGLVRGLEMLGRSRRATLYMTLSTVLATLLHKYSGTTDVVVGLPVGDRTRSDLTDVVGLFVNMLPLRVDARGDPTFAELLERVRRASLDAYRNRDLPFEWMVRELRLDRNGRTPLVRAVFGMEPPMGVLDFGTAAGTPQLVNTGTAKFDLTLSFVRGEDGGAVRLEYAEDVLDESTVEQLAKHLQRLAYDVVADPVRRLSALSLLTEEERRRLVHEWGGSRNGSGERCIHAAFEEQVERSPAAVAVVCGGREISYRELNRRANHLAVTLRQLGVRTEDRVGIYAHRSLDLVVGLLGVLKAGAAYVPLEPGHAVPRLARIVREGGVRLVLRGARLAPLGGGAADIELGDRLAQDGDEENLDLAVRPDNAAYVMYTSGSTGRPKGVVVEHRGVVSLVLGQRYAEFGPGRRLLQLSTPAFDASTFEIWGALLTGAQLVIYADDYVDLARLEQVVREHAVTTMLLTAGLFHQIVDNRPTILSGLAHVLTGGDVLSPDHAATARALLAPGRLSNAYGPTESTTLTSCFPLEEMPQTLANVPIGRPIASRTVYILGPAMELLPPGVPGELYTGGLGLARGYLGQPGLTAQRFVPDPFGPPGQRLYRTGDRARWRPDGTMDFLGRTDDQIKIRGYRVEPGEVEAALRLHPGVDQVAVVATEGPTGEKRLVAYVVPRDESVGVADVRRYAAATLPSYMAPAAVVMLPELPLTLSGKLDREALPAPDVRGPGSGFAAPRTAVERLLAEVWSAVLGVGAVDVRDDFFELGGHSLLATRVVSRVRQVLGVEVPLRSLFEAPTVAGFASAVERMVGRGAGPRPTARVDHTGAVPLSYAQQRLWFLDQLEPNRSTYNVPLVMRLTGDLDLGVLQRAISELVARHESLRTVFRVVDDVPRQIVDGVAPVAVRLVDVEGDCEARALVAEEMRRPFDLAAGPLLRVSLVRWGECDYVLILVMHHIVSDGWSAGVLAGELSQLYRALLDGGRSPLPPLPIQYADFAAWQRDWLNGGELDRQLEYWRERLTGAPPVVGLPADRPRPAVQSYRGARRTFVVDADVVAGLRELGHREGVTLFMSLLAAFDVLVYRYTGQPDVVVGSPIAGRNRVEFEGLIGFFVNTLALRVDCSGDPAFRELLGRVREVALGAFAHQDLPFERLVEELAPSRDLSRHPVFQMMFILQNTPARGLELPGLDVQPFDAPSTWSKFDLTLSMAEVAGELGGTVEYSTDLFDAGTIERLIGHFEVLLRAVVADPDAPLSRLPLSTPVERAQMAAWNDTAAAFPAGCLHELVERQVDANRDAVAVVFGTESLSYAELDTMANRLAHHLRGLGVRPDTLVGLYLNRSVQMVVALLGVLKAGGAYLPLDPEYPARRLEFMLADSAVPVLVTESDLVDRVPKGGARVVLLDDDGADIAGQPATRPAVRAGPDNLAYVIYTSGSTGTPKGVMVAHRSVVNVVADVLRKMPLAAGCEVVATTTLSFDISVLELFLPLAGGAVLGLVARDAVRDAEQLLAILRRPGVGLVQLTPSVLRGLLAVGTLPADVAVLCGGEALPSDVAQALRDRGGVAWNVYGPTETTIWSTAHEITGDDADPVPIGRPLANTHVVVVDRWANPVPVGMPGELLIGGVGLARGYLGRAGLTAARFVVDSTGAGERLYRTGDMVRWLPSGELEFLGRLDQQVKVRGHRIECGEVEAALLLHEAVREAAVIARDDGVGDCRLVGYLVGERGIEVGAVREFLRERLPDFMVPSPLVVVDSLPLTPNGKLDRAALPAPETASEAYLRHRSAQERSFSWELLAGLFAEVLGRPGVGPDDDFFELGGHSLLATRLISRIRSTFGVELPIRTLFEAATISRLADRLGTGSDRNALDVLLPLRTAGRGTPLFCVHPGNGIGWAFSGLLRIIGRDHPVYAIQARGLSEGTFPGGVDEMASDYVEQMRSVQPAGPYLLLGWCFGGVVAHAMASLLERADESVGLLAVMDGYPAQAFDSTREIGESEALGMLLTDLGCEVDAGERASLTRERYVEILAAVDSSVSLLDTRERLNLADCFISNLELARSTRLGKVQGDLVLLVPTQDRPDLGWATESWRPHVGGTVEAHPIDCHHTQMMSPSPVMQIGGVLAARLGQHR